MEPTSQHERRMHAGKRRCLPPIRSTEPAHRPRSTHRAAIPLPPNQPPRFRRGIPTGSAPAASGPIERQLQEAYRAIADMSVAISTSSAESRENARHAATSASFSYVPRSAPVASSITVNFAGVVRRAIVTPHNRMESVGYRADRRKNLALNYSPDGVCGRRDCIRADSVLTVQ